jgi:hypothetical protein
MRIAVIGDVDFAEATKRAGEETVDPLVGEVTATPLAGAVTVPLTLRLSEVFWTVPLESQAWTTTECQPGDMLR